jgi:hypothetical protein
MLSSASHLAGGRSFAHAHRRPPRQQDCVLTLKRVSNASPDPHRRARLLGRVLAKTTAARERSRGHRREARRIARLDFVFYIVWAVK